MVFINDHHEVWAPDPYELYRICESSISCAACATAAPPMVGEGGSGRWITHKAPSSPSQSSSSSVALTPGRQQQQLSDTWTASSKASPNVDDISTTTCSHDQLPQARREDPAGAEGHRQQAQDQLHQGDMRLQLRVSLSV